MNVETILRSKGVAVATVAPRATIRDAAGLLRRERIGALVVSGDATVEEMMTRRVFTCTPRDCVSDLMAMMTERRIRHIPVLKDGVLAGIVSIGDVVKHRLDEIEYEASSLRSFIAGA
jgi:CBS domain-containing protein